MLVQDVRDDERATPRTGQASRRGGLICALALDHEFGKVDLAIDQQPRYTVRRLQLALRAAEVDAVVAIEFH